MKQKSINSGKGPRAFDARETMRIREMHGLPLASFGRRATAFVIDFLLAFLLFLGVLIGGGKLAGRLGLLTTRRQPEIRFPALVQFPRVGGVLCALHLLGKRPYAGKNGDEDPDRITRSSEDGALALCRTCPRVRGFHAWSSDSVSSSILIHPNRRTVHDRIAETIVIDDRKVPPAKDSGACTASLNRSCSRS